MEKVGIQGNRENVANDSKLRCPSADEWIKRLCTYTQYQGFPDSSVCKESACNAGDPSLIPGSGSSPGEGIGYTLQYFGGFPGGSHGKEFPCNVEDLGSIPGLGRSPGGEHGNPLQYP